VGQAIVYTRAHQGLHAPLISVEVHLANGLPGFYLVGMAETCVKEARDRVRSALTNTDFDFPAKRITVNLAPADIRKQGGRYDLAIAIGILVASGHIRTDRVEGYEFIGELGLMGDLKPVPALLPSAQACEKDGRQLVFPHGQVKDLRLLQHLCRYPAASLLDVYHHLLQVRQLSVDTPQPLSYASPSPVWDDIQGQHMAKRALTIAAAGRHHLLMVGPPGSGKSSLASRFRGMLPPLSEEQASEVANIQAVAGVCADHSWSLPPFRAPHHTSSAGALIGGGRQLKPGEISLAHAGVLFLDELPEFGRKTLEALREPLETRRIHIARTAGQIEYPADFQLLAAMNPSPTGDWQDGRCSHEQVLRYLQRISGPMLERFDLQVEVQREGFQFPSLEEHAQHTDSAALAYQHILMARDRQQRRQQGLNAHLSGRELLIHCRLEAASERWLMDLASRLQLSQRSIHRMLRVARTIADLEGESAILHQHILEAASYRALEKIICQLNAH